MEIKYLRHNEIDKTKWNQCIANSFNGVVYAFSWYLDIVSYKWDALVLGNYIAVMPLTKQSKHLFVRLHQPEYAKKLGVFTYKILDNTLVNRFLEKIPYGYRSIDIKLNIFNQVSSCKYKVKQEFAYNLDLIQPYDDIYENFSEKTKEAIVNANSKNIYIKGNVSEKEFLVLKKRTSRKSFTLEDLNILRQIISIGISKNFAKIYGAYDKNNNLIAAVFFVLSHQKAIFLLSAMSEEGAKIGALYSLLSYYIMNNSSKAITLDFEASSNSKGNSFAKGFGASTVSYSSVKGKNLYSLIANL